MEILLANFAASTLAAPIAAGDVTVSIPLADAGKFPALVGNQRYSLVLTRKNTGEREIVLASALAANVFTIARAQEGTAALTFIAGDGVALRVTAGEWDSFRQITRQGPAIASANDLVPTSTYGYRQVSGTVQVNRIDDTGWNGGQRLTLKFNGALTVAHNQAAAGSLRPIFLLGSVNLARTAGQTLNLVYDETDRTFYQV